MTCTDYKLKCFRYIELNNVIKIKLFLLLVSVVRIDNPLVLKTDTQETENLDKAISLD
jgi:hypothetical protein